MGADEAFDGPISVTKDGQIISLPARCDNVEYIENSGSMSQVVVGSHNDFFDRPN